MNMEKVGSYSTYQSGMYGASAAAKDAKASKTADAKEANSTKKSDQVSLSRDAKKLLKELQKKYGNMDFIVANYDSKEEAASYLSRGTNDYSVLLSPEELEKMASDEDVKNENLKKLDGAVSQLDQMKEQLGDKADDVAGLGIILGDDGEVSFFAELEKSSEKQRERIEANRAAKKEDAAAAAKKASKEEAAERLGGFGNKPVKKTTVYADSADELIEKIKQVDWSKVKEERTSAEGQRFDFTV